MARLILRLVLIIIFSCLIPYNIPSQATDSEVSTEEYQPKPGRKRTQARKPGGYRGDACNSNLESNLTLIVPMNHIPLTTSSHPAFWWYVNSYGNPIRFTIYEPGQAVPLYTKDMVIEAPRIVSLKLPKHTPPLEIGKQYRWTVTVICNQKRPSENIYAKAWIERVEFAQKKWLELECMNNYAKAGIWHDALVCNRLNDKFWSLIEQVELFQIAQEKPSVLYFFDDLN